MRRVHGLSVGFVCFGMMILAGCSTVSHRSQLSSSLNVNMQSDLKADIEVDLENRLRGVAKGSTLFWVFDIEAPDTFLDGVSYNGGSGGGGLSFLSGGLTESVKSAAAYKATSAGKCDVLVFPQYQIKVTKRLMGMYKEVSAVVTGFAGRIKSIKSDGASAAVTPASKQATE